MNIINYLIRIIVSGFFWFSGLFALAIIVNFDCTRGSTLNKVSIILFFIMMFLGCGWLMWVGK